MRPCTALFALALGALCARAQFTITAVDGSGDTVVASIGTDADGSTTAIDVVSTIAAPADEDTDTETTEEATETTEEATETTYANGYDPACTTAGCVPRPTTYTQSGEIMTWYATTPTTPVPSWTSSGSVLGISDYISTTLTASFQGSAQRASGDWLSLAMPLASIVVAGMLGAVVVL